MTIDNRDKKLIDLALTKIRKRGESYSTVASAMRTKSGKIFVGVNVEQVHSGPCSICAEYTIVSQMQSDDDHQKEAIDVACDVIRRGIIEHPCRCKVFWLL